MERTETSHGKPESNPQEGKRPSEDVGAPDGVLGHSFGKAEIESRSMCEPLKPRDIQTQKNQSIDEKLDDDEPERGDREGVPIHRGFAEEDLGKKMKSVHLTGQPTSSWDDLFYRLLRFASPVRLRTPVLLRAFPEKWLPRGVD